MGPWDPMFSPSAQGGPPMIRYRFMAACTGVPWFPRPRGDVRNPTGASKAEEAPLASCECTARKCTPAIPVVCSCHRCADDPSVGFSTRPHREVILHHRRYQPNEAGESLVKDQATSVFPCPRTKYSVQDCNLAMWMGVPSKRSR